ncbi:hypothetical protein [Streptomyces sp. SP17KL33]|nr:hypothetical protein [Streptomyces sp. SP17KL33]MEE1838163.1 hypothetical protein [Streptomyces sp. SP17KL33]
MTPTPAEQAVAYLIWGTAACLLLLVLGTVTTIAVRHAHRSIPRRRGTL